MAGGGLALAAPPDGSDDEIEVAAESALEKWLISHGASFAVGTVACGVDSVSSKSVYCYSHTANRNHRRVVTDPAGDWAQRGSSR